MAAGAQPNSEFVLEPDRPDPPEVSVCRGGPGKSVFMELDNNDDWTLGDVTIDVMR